MKVVDFVNGMRSSSVVFGRETGVYVTFEGDQAYTDGKRINLPSMGLDKTLTQAQVRAMRGYVDHEAGHVRHSDMPLIMDFYKRCANNGKMDLKTLHNCIEDVWMEHKVVDCYPGSKKNLAQVNELVSEQGMKADEDNGWDPSAWHPGNAGLATKWNNPMYSTPKFLERQAAYGDKLNKYAKVWAQQAIECKNSQDTIDLAMAIWKLFEQPESEAPEPEDFDPKSGDPMESIGEPGDMQDEDVQEGVGKPAKGKAGDGEGAEGQYEKMPDDYLPTMEDALTSTCEGGDGQGGIGNMTGDFTGSYRVYSTAEDVTYTRGGDQSKGSKQLHKIVNSNDMSNHQQVMANISGPINVMSSKLRRALLAKKRVDRDAGRELGRLDSKRLVAGSLGARNVFYQRVDRKEEDTAITILVDLSGSMGGRKAIVARDSTLALAECLEGSSMPFKVVGFCNKRGSHGRGEGGYHRYEPLDTVVFKGYNNSMKQSRAAVAQLDDAVGGNNSDYDFIQQELHELKKRPEQRKVLFVLSDGHPACYSDASTSEHVKHCKEAIREAAKDGVECVGIGICDSAVKEIYKDYVVVNDVNDLSSTVFNKLTNMLVGIN